MSANSDIIKIGLTDLSLGMFSDVNPFNVPLGGAVDAFNVVWLNGVVRPRPGLVEVYGPPPDAYPVVSLSQFYDSTGASYLMRVSLNVLVVHVWSSDGTTWTRVTPILGLPLGIAGHPPSVTSFKWKWYLAPGNGPLYSWDGVNPLAVVTNADPLHTPPDIPHLVAANDERLFLADVDDPILNLRVPYRIDVSNFLDDSTWLGGTGGGTSGYELLPNKSTQITGLYANNAVIMVFKPNEIYLGYDSGSPANWVFKSFLKGPGCISQHTIKEWRNGAVIWLGDDNVYLGVPGERPQALGDRIRPALRTYAHVNMLDQAVASIDLDNDLYTIFLPAGSGNKNGLAFTINLRNGSWWRWVYPTAQDFRSTCEFRLGTWQTIQLLGDANSKIYQSTFGQVTDYGSTFPTSWTSGILQIKQIKSDTEQAMLEEIRGLAASGQVIFSVAHGTRDRMRTDQFATQVFNGVAPPIVTGRFTGEHFQIIFSYPTPATAAPLEGIVAGYIMLGDSRK